MKPIRHDRPTPPNLGFRLGWGASSVVAAAVFVACAAVQFNDPDPALWVVAYGLTAVISLVAGFTRTRPWGMLTWAIAFGLLTIIVWTVSDDSGVLMGDPNQGIFAHEQVRELGGLALCTAWLLIAAGASWLRLKLDANAR